MLPKIITNSSVVRYLAGKYLKLVLNGLPSPDLHWVLDWTSKSLLLRTYTAPKTLQVKQMSSKLSLNVDSFKYQNLMGVIVMVLVRTSVW